MGHLGQLTHDAACWWWNAANVPGLPDNNGTVATGFGNCNLYQSHTGYIVLVIALALTVLLSGSIIIAIVDHAKHPDARVSKGDALFATLIVGFLSCIVVGLAYVVIMAFAQAGTVLTTILAAILLGWGIVYSLTNAGARLTRAWTALRSVVSVTAALERRRQRVERELADKEAQLQRTNAMLLRQRQQLEQDPYGRHGLAEVDRLVP